MKVKKWKLASFLLPCLLLFALIYLAPMCMVFGSSFFEWKAGGVFNFIGLDNYFNAFRNDARMLTALKNTGIWVILQSVVHVTLGTVIAFMLSKRKKGWKVLRTIYMIPNVVSAAALAVIFLNVFNAQYGIINSFVKTVTGKPFMKNWFFDQNSAFITVTWSWLLYTGMIIILVLAGVLSIPEDVVEAAKIDGANAVQTFFKITLPYMLFVMTPYLITQFTGNVNNFNVIFLLSGGNPTPVESTAGKTDLLVTWLYKLTIEKNYYNLGAVIGIMTFIVLAIVALVTYRNTTSYKDEEGFM